MGSATKATSRRSPPSSLRTQKGLPRVSPAWRLRTRSCSHDNELYRMGLKKNAAGEWDAIDNLPTAGLAAAMRAMRIKSGRRSVRRESSKLRRSEVSIKTEPTADSTMEVDMGSGNLEDETEAAEDHVIDLTDSTAVFEEIRVYLDIDMEVEGGHTYVDEDGVEVETVMTSVEATKTEFKVEVKGHHVRQLAGNRGSVASIVEETEYDDQAIGESRAEDLQEPEEMNRSDETNQYPAGKRPKRKWTDAELLHVGALLDAGRNAAEIVSDFNTAFHESKPITISSVSYCRFRLLQEIVLLERIRAINEQAGSETGKWHKMQDKLKEVVLDASGSISLEQRSERQEVMERHRRVIEQLNEELQTCNFFPRRVEIQSAIYHSLIDQRQLWREMLIQQSARRHDKDVSLPESVVVAGLGEDYLAQLTILLHQSKHILEDKEAWFRLYEDSFAIQADMKAEIEKKRKPPKQGHCRGPQTIQLYEYNIALLFLKKYASIPSDELVWRTMTLLGFDKETSESGSDALIEREKEEELAKKKLDSLQDYQMQLVPLEHENKHRFLEHRLQHRAQELGDTGEDPSVFFSRKSSVPSAMTSIPETEIGEKPSALFSRISSLPTAITYNTTELMLVEKRSRQALLIVNTTERAIESSANDRDAINNADVDNPVIPVERFVRCSICKACGRCRNRKIPCSGATGPQGDGGCSSCKKSGVDDCDLKRVQARELRFAEPLNDYSNLGTTLPMQLPTGALGTQNQYYVAPPNYPPAPSNSNQQAAHVSQNDTAHLPGLHWTTRPVPSDNI